MTKTQRALAGLVFMDDTDLIVDDESNSAEQVGHKM